MLFALNGKFYNEILVWHSFGLWFKKVFQLPR